MDDANARAECAGCEGKIAEVWRRTLELDADAGMVTHKAQTKAYAATAEGEERLREEHRQNGGE